MAMPVTPPLIGIDVSKAELHICLGPEQALMRLPNERGAIRRWLATLAPSAELAVEATNTFHLEVLAQAHRRGHTCYVLDGYRLNRYRQSLGGRAKTDACDARLLQRYLAHERTALRPWSPPPAGYLTLQRLLHRRAVLVQARVALVQSLRELPGMGSAVRALTRQFARLDALIQQRLRQALQAAGWAGDVRRCQAIEGVGPITAAALTMAFRRGAFASSDAFVAFLGLDVRVRDSGQSRGRRRLTKQGDPELRRLLYLAAMQASRSACWRAYYQRHLGRGRSKIQALVILARKLARVAFALLKNQSHYQPCTPQEACMAT